jgi:Mn-dependent DtxR family transcriptional regulator
MTLLDAVIECVREQRTVRLAEVLDCCGHERRQVLRVMDKLSREGYLVEIADQPEPPNSGEMGPARRNPTWRVVKDPSARPPKNRPRAASLRSKLWRLIRAKHRFTKSELATCSGVSLATVDDYVRELELNSWVRRTGKDGASITYICARPNQVEPPRGLFGGAK